MRQNQNQNLRYIAINSNLMATLMIGETNKTTVAENLYKKQDIRVYICSLKPAKRLDRLG